MSEWQQQRAVLVALAERARRPRGVMGQTVVESPEAAAIEAALALADRAAELEAVLVEERAVVAALREAWHLDDQDWADLQAQDRGAPGAAPRGYTLMDSTIEQARAAHRNAAQQPEEAQHG